MKEKNYDLENRTLVFSKELTKILRSCARGVVDDVVIRQLARSGTSIGANYCEANGAVSPADFKHKISLCKKEAKETVYWISILKSFELDVDLDHLENEANQLAAIFTTIFSKIK